MRISDWSSDVCSSDLLFAEQGRAEIAASHVHQHPVAQLQSLESYAIVRGGPFILAAAINAFEEPLGQPPLRLFSQVLYVVAFEIGRASCRERVCQYV